MGAVKRNTLSVLFIIKKAKLLKNGEAPICMRITVNKRVAEVIGKSSVSCPLKPSDSAPLKHSTMPP